MFAPLSHFPRRDPDEIESPLIQETRVEHPREPRSRKLELVLAVCWVLVIAKCAFVYWACLRYEVPISPWWIIGPTLAFASLCTLVYWRRD
jgi:hypothetical protein